MKFLILSLCLAFSAALTAKECIVTSANEAITYKKANCNNLNKKVEISGLKYNYDGTELLDIIAGTMPQSILNGLCKNFGLTIFVGYTGTIYSPDIAGVVFTKEDLSEGDLMKPTADGKIRPIETMTCK